MKILWFDKQEKGAAGGMAAYTQEVTTALTQKKHQVMILRFGDKVLSTDPPNSRILPYSLGDKALFFLPNRKTFQIVKEALAEFKPDIIHLNLAVSPLDFYLPKLAHQKNIPIVGTFHSGLSSNTKLTLENLGAKSYFLSYRSCFSQLDKLLIFSTQGRDFLISLGLSGKNLEVLPNSVDCQKYTPGQSVFKKKNSFDFGYLFLGRVSPLKNPRLLIETFLKLTPPKNHKLILVGGGDIGSLYHNLRKTYCHNQNIIFTGPIFDTKQKIDIIRAADVFILPSLLEGMSLALLESMACGLAPIVSNAGNHEEVVDDTGLVIEINKIKDQLPVALQIFFKNPSLAKTLGQKARQRVLEKYNQEEQINKLIKIYQEVILTYRS